MNLIDPEKVEKQKKNTKKYKWMLLKIKLFKNKSLNYFSGDDVNQNKQYFIQRNPKQLYSILTKIYIFSYIWGFGGSLKVIQKII